MLDHSIFISHNMSWLVLTVCVDSDCCFGKIDHLFPIWARIIFIRDKEKDNQDHWDLLV